MLLSFFLFSAVCSAIIGNIPAFMLTVISVCLLVFYKNPKPNAQNAEKVLQLHKTSIIAHRGGANDCPENTLASFREAKKNGADGVEFDLEFTSDGVPILLHDETLERTTDGSGAIRNMNFEKVLELNASAKHPRRDEFPNEKVPTLEEAVKLCLELDMKMYIDVKGNSSKATETLLEIFKKYPEMYQNAIVCSFWPQIAYLMRRADPDIVVGLTYRSKENVTTMDGELLEECKSMIPYVLNLCKDYILGWCVERWLWYLVGSSAYLVHIGDVSKQQVKYFKDRGISVVVWTPNAKYEKDYISKTLGSSYITDTVKT